MVAHFAQGDGQTGALGRIVIARLNAKGDRRLATGQDLQTLGHPAYRSRIHTPQFQTNGTNRPTLNSSTPKTVLRALQGHIA